MELAAELARSRIVPSDWREATIQELRCRLYGGFRYRDGNPTPEYLGLLAHLDKLRGLDRNVRTIPDIALNVLDLGGFYETDASAGFRSSSHPMAKTVGAGVREKLRRAHMHRQDFERRVDRFVHSGAYTEVREDDVEAGKRRWIVQVHKRPPLIRWGALIGECLFDFRSALDHLAYDLAVANNKGRPLPPSVEENSEFPIFPRAPRGRTN